MSERRWVVRTGDPRTVAAIARLAAPDDAPAVAEGRVFVGRTRVTDGAIGVAVGDVVVVHAARALPSSATAVRVLDERDGVVAAEKPAELPTIADHHGTADTLVSRLAATIGCATSDLHATSRLDVGVSGVVLVARTKAARERLAAARDEDGYARAYVAIAARAPGTASGTWTAPIGRAQDPRKRAAFGRDAAPSVSRFTVIATAPGGQALLLLQPETGRTHQLRVHASHAGAPLLGDATYGGPTRVTSRTGAVRRIGRIALHARVVVVPDARGAGWRVEAPVPDELRDLWSVLDGDPSTWDKALP